MSDNGAMTPPTCDHAYVSIHQPDMPVYWIRQCAVCKAFDAEDLRREIAKAQEVGGDNTEYGLRDDNTGIVHHWGAVLWGSDPKNFPGYTLVTRTVGGWTALTPEEGGADVHVDA